MPLHFRSQPDPIDAIQRARSTRFRAAEEFDGVRVEGEALELADEALREHVLKVKDVHVQGDVHQRADEDESSKEDDDTNHNPILSLDTNLKSCLWLKKIVVSPGSPFHLQCGS